MKFKRHHAQNQRLERITMSHLVVGIDIAKETHTARAVNFRGFELGRSIQFPNNLQGFERLLVWMNSLQKQHTLTSTIIGLESTGHYWFNLANWLVEQGMEVVLVNPMTVKRNKENRDNTPSKNDVKDAFVIAESVSRGFYSELRQQADVYKRLRSLMNNREHWSDLHASLANKIIRWMDLYFPELAQLFTWNSPRGIATLKAFSLPSAIRDLTPQQVVERWYDHMQRAGGPSGCRKASELIALAKSSVGDRECAAEARRELLRLLAQYEQMEAYMAEVDQDVAKLLHEQLPGDVERFGSIKGFSPLYMAVILANAGDLSQYAHGRQLLSHAGLNLAESTSGKYKGQIKLSKRGRRQLRKYLYLAVLGLVMNNPSFAAWHRHNVEVLKMKKQRSLFKLIGKLCRILVAMARNQTVFVEGTVEPSFAA